MSPTPAGFYAGSLDMTLRELLVHMTSNRLDHAVLVIPGADARVTITVADEQKTAQLTKQVEKLLKGFVT